ncbi:MAG TPA: DMT family transporter, partial [Gammaproteobacteria bacterium]|nr:DMT family transporter [Gammaproteobacteria bacterium]
IQLIIGAVMISFSAVFVKLTTVGPDTAAFYRVLLGGSILAVIVLARRERLWPGRRAAAMIGVAAIFFALDLLFWHRSIHYVGPGIATLIPNFQVFVLAGAGVLFFGERWRWQLGVALPVAILGLFLLVGWDWSAVSTGYRLGIGLGLLTAAVYAGYILALRSSRVRVVAGYSDIARIAAVSLACAALLAGAVVAGAQESFAIPSWRDAGILLAYGVCAQVLGWVLISKSLVRLKASQVGLILLLQPVLAFIWDVLFFDRRFGAVQIAGAVIALAAVYLGQQGGSA